MIRRLVLCAALVLVGAAHAETRFLTTLQDMPLAPGLEERTRDAFVFATPGGRILQTQATGGGGENDARDYYRRALPALGWALKQETPDMVYARGGERLELHFIQPPKGGLEVRYRIITQPASAALD